LQFYDRQLQISDRGYIIGAQNFASKSPKWGIFSSKFCIFGRKFSDQKKLFRQTKIYGGGGQLPLCLPATTSRNRSMLLYFEKKCSKIVLEIVKGFTDRPKLV